MAYFWQSDFSKVILQRGKEYFQNNNVQKLNIEEEDKASAYVSGNEEYYVTVRKTQNGLFRYSCNCPYTLNCKHEAAVCYALENEGFFENQIEPTTTLVTANQITPEIKKVENLVHPFKNFLKDEDSYHYFDMEKMTENLEFTESIVNNAEKIIQENKITSASEFKHINENLSFESFITNDGKPYQVSILFNQKSIEGTSCSVPNCMRTYGFYSWYAKSNKVCAHATAALLALGKQLYETNPGDATDKSGEELCNLFKTHKGISKKHEAEPEEINDSNKVLLKFEPTVEIRRGYLSASFKFGSDKMYVLKEYEDFINARKNKEIFEQTQNFKINFNNVRFDEKSEKYLDLVQKIVEEENAKKMTAEYSFSGELTAEKISNGIKIYGSRLDDFFEISENSFVSVKKSNYTSNSIKSLMFQNKDSKLQLELTTTKNPRGEVECISCRGSMPELFHGARNLYFIDDDSFNRLSPEFSEKIKSFTKISSGALWFNFNIGRKKISFFMNQVLPWLKTFSEITEEDLEDVKPLVIPEPEYRFFLDSQNDLITCLAKVIYGEREYDLCDWIFGEAKTELRDYEEEDKVHDVLSKYFQIDRQLKCLVTEDEDKIYELLNSGIFELMNLGQVNASESFRKIKIKPKVKAALGIKLESGLLDLEVTSDEVTREELLTILEGMRKKKKYVRLRNGDFIGTEGENLEELEHMMETLHISEKDLLKGKIHIPSYRALYLDKMLESCRELNAERDKNFRSLVKEFKTVDDSDFEVPDVLQKIMRNYQVHGFKWLRTLKEYNFSGILADDMGLGKTLQTISLLLALKNESGFGTSLIICPASLVFNWSQEFIKFAPELNVCPVTGTASERKKLISNYKNFDVLITSYDLLKRDISEYDEKTFFYEIIDEGQFIKNQGTNAAKSVKIIQAEHCLALTGTPIENRLSELWSIFDFLMPGFLFSYDDFRRRFELSIVKDKDEKKSEQLRRMVSPFILRRLKKDVLKDLPEKTEEIYFAQLEDKQKKLYDAQAIKLIQSVEKTSEKDFSKNKIQILAELTKIRQICCDPSLTFENYTGDSAKRNACLDLIEQGIEGEHKMLIFSQFTSMLELLQKDLDERGIKYFVITGSTDKESRLKMVNTFNEDDTPVFLISLKAGGTGLNLTGADIVIHYDPWWNLAAQNQATDRAHRIGQTKNVTVFKLIAKDTIEEKIVELQNNKKNLADQILSGENGNISSLSKDELLSLFG
ncbi:MAG: DEAD/DEAH box helicase [Treponema sp.]|nr:DEAD/DEAH box helicase [Treponema sp.]